MLRVTWKWLGQDPALDLANTVAVVEGDEHDMIASAGEYERWADAEAAALDFEAEDAAALLSARSRVLAVREAIRAAVAAVAEAREIPPHAASELNRASRAAPEWVELDPATATLQRASRGRTADRIVASYARAAMRLLAGETAREIRRCPAPSCGMFYRPGRSDQHWCSPQCGSRARVARYYRAQKRRA